MAIIPETAFPGKITPSSASYPLGEARDVTTPGDGTGTPWKAILVNDIFGMQQAILAEAGITASGTAETAVASQYKDGLKVVLGGAGAYEATINYPQFSYTKGSNGRMYLATAANGPATTVVNPVGDATGTWFDLASSPICAELIGVAPSNSSGANQAALVAADALGVAIEFRPAVVYPISAGFTAVNNINYSCRGGVALIENTAAPVDTGNPSADAVTNGVIKVPAGKKLSLNNMHLRGNYDGVSTPGVGYPPKGVVCNCVGATISFTGDCQFSRGIEYGVRFQESSGHFVKIEAYECGYQGIAWVNNSAPLSGELAVGHDCGQNGFDAELSASFGVGFRNARVDKIVTYNNKNGCSITNGPNDATALAGFGITAEDLKFSVGDILSYGNSEMGVRLDITEVDVETIRVYGNGTRGIHFRNADDGYAQRVSIGGLYAEDNVGFGAYIDGSTLNPAEYIRIGLLDSQRNTDGFFIAASAMAEQIEIDALYTSGNTNSPGNIPSGNNKNIFVKNWIGNPQGDEDLTYTVYGQVKSLSNDGVTSTTLYLPKGALVTDVFVNVTAVDSTAGARWRINHISGGTVNVSDIRADTLGTRRISLGDKALLGSDTDDAPLPFNRDLTFGRIIQADPVSTWTGGEAEGEIAVKFVF